MTDIQEFIKQNGLSMECQPTKENPTMPNSENMDHWFCSILNENSRAEYEHEDDPTYRLTDQYAQFTDEDRIDLVFSMGSGHNGRQPELADVLDCIASDAAGFASAPSFEEWAADYGYDEDSRTAERVYKACEEQADKLSVLLGTEFETLLYDTERL